MAEALAKKLLAGMGKESGIKVISAGTAAMEGAPAASEAVKVMKAKGIDITGHHSQPLTIDMVKEADLVLTMTQGQKKHVLNTLPSSYGRVYTLKEYILEGEGDSKDLQEMAACVAKLEEKLRKFYETNGARIEALRNEYNENNGNLLKQREIESRLLEIEEEFAECTRPERDRITLLEEKKTKLEIADPYGQSIEVYASCAKELEDNIEKAIIRFFSEIE